MFSLQWAYLKQQAVSYLPLTIAALLSALALFNYAYHGWQGLIGPFLLAVAFIALAVDLLQEGDRKNEQIRQRLFEETTRANRLELERHALEVEVDRLSRPPTANDLLTAAQQLIEAGLTQRLQDNESRYPGTHLTLDPLTEQITAEAEKGPA